ncbi:MAG TPA: hypothetical protein VGM29_02005 [Polyangiaceae bacterium]|jgi:hypothetical protein
MSDFTAPFVPPPEPIPDFVTACLEYVRRAVGVDLDFTPDTLPILDHYTALARENVREKPAMTPMLTQAVGAYFGEVVRGRFPGFWRVPSGNVHDWAICSRVVFLWFNPIGMAFDALFAGTEHEGPRSMLRVAPEDHDFLHARLAAIPPLPEDQYFLLSTRFEVIEIAVEALRARMDEGGYGDTGYSEDDYEPAS